MTETVQDHYPGFRTDQYHVGNSTTPVVKSDANLKFFQEYISSTDTTGDNRLRYSRLYLDGAGAGGETLRAFTTVRAACGTAHGAHISLNFAGDTTGSLSGLGCAIRGTLHIPNDAAWTSGTLAALQAEIYSDGSASDSDGLTELSYIRIVNGGDATGGADIDDDASLMSIQGHTIGSGNMIVAETDETKFSHKARIKIGSTTYYVMLCAT